MSFVIIDCYDVEHSIIMNGYWISSICEQVFSPTVMRKLRSVSSTR